MLLDFIQGVAFLWGTAKALCGIIGEPLDQVKQKSQLLKKAIVHERFSIYKM